MELERMMEDAWQVCHERHDAKVNEESWKGREVFDCLMLTFRKCPAVHNRVKTLECAVACCTAVPKPQVLVVKPQVLQRPGRVERIGS